MILSLILILTSIVFSVSKDVNTFSNYEIIKQTKLEGTFYVDFTNKVIEGEIKLFFHAEKDGEVIILDTRALKINTVLDCDANDKLEFVFDEKYSLDANGVPLKIFKEFSKGDNVTILINYATTKDGSAVQFLDKEQTTGKEYPYMFTQCECMFARELLPIQDTPAVKLTTSIGLTVPKPLMALNSGLFKNKKDNSYTVTYYYEQNIPIPSYLIAFAAGAIEERVISNRIRVYSEKDIVDKAAKEFDEMEDFLKTAEDYTFPYVWGQYNLLILPSSFPFGGMENPTLTFVTPSLIAGDKSLANVVIHEMCHSWSGNLVTMDNWSDFWLNEGFTMFLQRKIVEKLYNLDLAKLDALVLYNTMADDILIFGESNSFSSLRPNLLGRNADDAYSELPYEKGFGFLYYLEGLVNSRKNLLKIDDLFKIILREYFSYFSRMSIKYEDFRDFFIEKIKNYFNEETAEEILNKINWVQWIEEPGFPPVKNDFSNKYEIEVKKAVAQFYENSLPYDFKETFTGWHTLLKQYFLSNIKETDKELDDTQLNLLSKELDLKEGYNSEVNFGYFSVVLLHGKVLDDEFKNALIAFLGKYGRQKFIRPLYRALYVRDKETALKTFEKWKSTYHPIAVKGIESDFKSLE